MKRLLTAILLSAALFCGTASAQGQLPGATGTFTFPDTVNLGDTVQINAHINLPGGLSTQPITLTALLIQDGDTTTLCEGSLEVTDNNELIYSLNCVIPDDINLGEHSIVIIISGAFGEFMIPGGGMMHITGDHDINGDGSLNIADATGLLSYIFNNGEPPQPSLANADFNCDGTVNISDVVKIIQRIFQAASLPCYSG